MDGALFSRERLNKYILKILKILPQSPSFQVPSTLGGLGVLCQTLEIFFIGFLFYVVKSALVWIINIFITNANANTYILVPNDWTYTQNFKFLKKLNVCLIMTFQSVSIKRFNIECLIIARYCILYLSIFTKLIFYPILGCSNIKDYFYIIVRI